MDEIICVVGLGYVGLPLAVAFSNAGFKVIGFDVNETRISELKQFKDNSCEISEEELKNAIIDFTYDSEFIKKANFIVVCVPTPITEDKKPDLKYIESASRMIGKNFKKDSIVVFESTVYPGVTEDICLPILEKESGLKCPNDFKIGYSPERINPGDKQHTIDKIVKVVSGIDEDSLKIISDVYSKITTAGVFPAKTIRTAEAAKVIENIQRDLNIALMNELSLIFDKLGLRTKDVLEAAGTKWNFHNYFPGLVGGHCIGVDPYYLTYKAEEFGFNPKVILAGRVTNDFMSKHVAELVIKGLNEAGKILKNSKVLLLGLTFKENVRDSRNSKSKDIILELQKSEVNVIGYEPNLNIESIKTDFGIDAVNLESVSNIDCVIFVNKHKQFETITLDYLKTKMSSNPIIIDLKSLFDEREAVEKGFIYKSL
ncbi:MAG: nucleotide sugar dehydrogenase [Nanoarchaeota archaeon]|nr:nucleotide sugar dehydrogenase [Nanoarchaeota archaeon]